MNKRTISWYSSTANPTSDHLQASYFESCLFRLWIAQDSPNQAIRPLFEVTVDEVEALLLKINPGFPIHSNPWPEGFCEVLSDLGAGEGGPLTYSALSLRMRRSMQSGYEHYRQPGTHKYLLTAILGALNALITHYIANLSSDLDLALCLEYAWNTV